MGDFSDIVDQKEYVSTHAWEVTRVFVAKRDRNAMRNAAALFWGGCHMGLSVGINSFVSITPKLMTRVFAACGWKGEILQTGRDALDGEICACRWPINDHVLQTLKRRARPLLEGVSPPFLQTTPWSEPTESSCSVALHELQAPVSTPHHFR